MKYFSTLGDLLLRQYVVDFVSQMQNLSMAGKIMNWHTVEEDTNFGKLLHKEDLWSLYQFREEKSLLYHLCRNEYGRMELRNNPCDPADGQCTVCQKQAPDEIKGLWTLHNFEWVQEQGEPHV